ncbi:hypothetical protein P7H12_21285 [Paenibacillus larvae]|nr:hypothetical protein [Paenibacillus larvae]MDT2265599.1 hypothetical protein [Paenibacillus larvae]
MPMLIGQPIVYTNWLREKLGLSAQLGGTGYFKTSVLKNIGWGTESLTEDLEYVARYALATGKLFDGFIRPKRLMKSR